MGITAYRVKRTCYPKHQFLFFLTGKREVAPLLKKRNKFDHKGTFGHGLLIAGSYGKMGAAVLGASSALRTGIGLITCHVPSSGVVILQSVVPEAMVESDRNENHLSELGNPLSFGAVGIGPGIGTDLNLKKLFINF